MADDLTPREAVTPTGRRRPTPRLRPPSHRRRPSRPRSPADTVGPVGRPGGPRRTPVGASAPGRRRDGPARHRGDGGPPVARRERRRAPIAVAAADPGTVTIVAGTPASIDPARHGDLGSASFVSQLYETLTAVDPSLTVRPALAESWAVDDDGRQVTFTLREASTFSDGTPLTRGRRRPQLAAAVHARAPVPAGVAGRRRRRARATCSAAPRPTSRRWASARRATARWSSTSSAAAATCRRSSSSAPFAIVPATVGDDEIAPAPGKQRRQRRLHARPASTRDAWVLKANPHYWAGTPAIEHRPDADDARPARARSTRSSQGDGRRRPRSGSSTPAGSPTTRTSGPSLRSDPSLSVDVLRLRRPRAAVRQPARPPGVREGRRLEAARGARRAGLVRGRDGHGAGGDAGRAGRATSCRPTTRPAPASC